MHLTAKQSRLGAWLLGALLLVLAVHHWLLPLFIRPSLAAPLPQDPYIQVYFNQSQASAYTDPYRRIQRHGDDLEAVLATYKKNRLAGSDFFQKAAVQSIAWYESIDSKLHFDPVTFAFSYMSRTGAIDYERLRKTDMDFVRAFEAAPSTISVQG